MNLYKLMTTPAFHKAALEMAKHWPARFHPNCLPTRIAAVMMFGDDEDEQRRKEAARALDEGQLPEDRYDDRLPELLPELVDLSDFYDVPLAVTAQALLAVSKVYWRPDVQLLHREEVLHRMAFGDPSMRRLELQGRVPPPIKLTDGRSVWTEPAIEGWREVVEPRRQQPYRRDYLVYPPYDGDRLSKYTMEQWLKQQEKKKNPQP